MNADVVDTAAGPVEYAEQGSGPAVLIVHGTPGDWRQARVIADDLASRHRVVLPSRPGYGRTPLATGRTPEQQGAAHAGLLTALGVDRAAVVGISGGGPSARAFAAHHRDRCTHLVLCCAVAEHLLTVPAATRLLAAVPGLWSTGARLTVRRERRRLEDRAGTLARLMAELGPAERVALEQDARTEEDLLGFARTRVEALRSVTGLRNDYRSAIERREAAPWPDGPTVPTLVLHGDADQVVPLSHGEHHAASIPGAVLEVLPGAGHGFVLSMRRTTSARIADFMEVQ